MDQIKIGKFISTNRKKKNLTQEQLAEKLGISKNAVSKWERGLNLPDVSIMQELCGILDITLNELFSGEIIEDEKYKEVADNNLLEALENSSFTIKDKIAFYKKKWRKDHLFNFILGFVIWIALLIALKLQGVEGYLLGAVSGVLTSLIYFLFYNQMMAYVEKNAYDKTENKDYKK